MKDDQMLGSISDKTSTHMAQKEGEISPLPVMCVPLSTYLNEPVTYQTIVASSINDRVAAANPYFPW